MNSSWRPTISFVGFCCLLPLTGWMIPAAAGDPVAIVPPVNEIEILDPRVDPRGIPRAIVTPGPGNLQVEVPPSVIVHRYYYTGDREFQAALIPGGPTILVVNHPRTGEKLYIEVQLLPGVPRIKYTRDSIVYDYGRRRITIKFAHLGRPKVTYRDTSGADRAREHWATHVAHTRDWIHRTGIPHAVHHVAHGTGEALNATADRIHDAGRMVAAPATRLWRAAPVSSLLEAAPPAPALPIRESSMLESLPVSFDSLEGAIPTVR